MKASKDEMEKNHHKQKIAKFILVLVRTPFNYRALILLKDSFSLGFCPGVFGCCFGDFGGFGENFVMLIFYFIPLSFKEIMESKYGFAF